MKKIIIVALALTATSVGAFAQGNFFFGGATKCVWDVFSTGIPMVTAGTVNLTFLIGTGASPLASLASSTATNGTTVINGNPWTSITSALSAGTWQVATNGSTQVVATTSVSPANGAFVYNSSIDFQDPFVSGGKTYNVQVIGWQASAGSTLDAAAAAGAPIGLAAMFSYASTSGITTPPVMSNLIMPFGVVETPEPSTMALAGLGIALLIPLRRRNQ